MFGSFVPLSFRFIFSKYFGIPILSSAAYVRIGEDEGVSCTSPGNQEAIAGKSDIFPVSFRIHSRIPGDRLLFRRAGEAFILLNSGLGKRYNPHPHLGSILKLTTSPVGRSAPRTLRTSISFIMLSPTCSNRNLKRASHNERVRASISSSKA